MDASTSLKEKSTAAHYSIYDAKRALNARKTDDSLYVRERMNIDLALLFLTKAKWHAGRFTGTHIFVTDHTQSESDVQQALLNFDRSMEIAIDATEILTSGDHGRTNAAADRYRGLLRIQRNESEIAFVDDIPIVPAICPIVILQGSSYEMGRQYVQQVSDIFGNWVFRRIAERKYSSNDVETIKKWHVHIEKDAPEIGEMVKGWVDAAKELSIDLNYWNAIQLWTGHFAPIWEGIRGHGVRDLDSANLDSNEQRADTSYLGGQSTSAVSSDDSVDLCSGCCAWGDATSDGALVVGSTTDHDCTFQATIVAFPDVGNAFIYTPFSVTGFIPGLGQYYFAGHPGMNNKGVAYVHHGGGLHGIETEEDRGYGIRRGASVFHNLRFSSSANEALSKELSWPIGDVGSILGSVGGFYADCNYAYVCEARPSVAAGKRPIIREYSFDDAGHQYSFLYANNNSMHPRSSDGFAPPPQGYQFNSVEGWFCSQPAALAHLGDRQLVPALSTKSSQGRNRYLFDSLKAAYGRIDVEVMSTIFRTSAPERYTEEGIRLSHKEREIAWSSGKPWPSSICHRVNAFSAVIKPDKGSDGLYMGCIGPANHRALMHIPGHGYYYYDEVNEFWEIRLKESPRELVANAKVRAEQLLDQAENTLQQALFDASQISAINYFDQIHSKATSAIADGEGVLNAISDQADFDTTLRNLSMALRHFTTAQVRAKQLLTELGLRSLNDAVAT